jgi:hypothetical protein
MQPHKSELERAFELARSGTCASVQDIIRRLRSEAYGAHQVIGRTLGAQLRAVIAQAKSLETSATTAEAHSECLRTEKAPTRVTGLTPCRSDSRFVEGENASGPQIVDL